jgi:hypothetical protein
MSSRRQDTRDTGIDIGGKVNDQSERKSLARHNDGNLNYDNGVNDKNGEDFVNDDWDDDEGQDDRTRHYRHKSNDNSYD